MRKSHLFNATALGLVMAVAITAQAGAETTINTSTTAPVSTATIGTGNTADDIKIDAKGIITLKSGTAVTINSNNKLNIASSTDGAGFIDMSSSASGATGVHIDGGRTSGITVAGKITVTDDHTPTDTDTTKDGITDGRFATGTGRYGIRSTGATPFIGDVTLSSGSNITVEGNESYGVRFENGLNGNFTSEGTVAVVGDNSKAFSFENIVNGRVVVGGTATAQGENAQVLNVSGGVNGALIIDGALTGTGYRVTAIPDKATLDKLAADPENVWQSGPLVSISSNVTKGVLIQSAIADTDAVDAATKNPDEDGNGITDTSDGAASLTQFGGAAALQIGSATQDITLNAIEIASTATDKYKDQKYGLVVRGAIASSGLFEGVNTKAIETGGLGRTVTFENGILVTGAVSSAAYLAESRAISLLSGTQAPKVVLSGTVRGTASSTKNETAYGLYIGSGANVPEVEISGSLGAASTGSKSNATAIFDGSNALSKITNTGNITASITATDDNEDGVADEVTNRAVAIDVRNNTTGLTLNQTDLKPDDDAVAAPFISGDILLGGGADVLNIKGGFILGNIDFGAGANSLTLDTKAIVAGKMTGVGTVDIDIVNGSLNLAIGSRLNASELNVRKDGVLRFIPDTANPTVPMIVGSGAAVFDDGAKIQLGFSKIIRDETRYTLLTAPSISLGNIDTASLDSNIPYLYKAAVSTDTAKTSLYADVRLRNQSETTLSVNEFAAFDAIMTAAQGSTSATAALLAPTDAIGFENAYLSFLPDYSGETLLSLSKSNDGLSKTLAAQSIIPSTGTNQYWLQEYGYQITRDRAEVTGFESRGFAFAGGVERGFTSTQAVGVYLGYNAASPTDTMAAAEEDMTATDLSLGVYWRMDNGSGLKGWVRGGVGYTKFETTRQILQASYVAKAEGDWKGVSYSGSAGASYGFDAGFLSITPMISADYYGLKEEAYTEEGSDAAFDLSIEERTSHLFSGTALLNFGRANKNALFRPEVWVGYRNNFSVEIGDTVARFGDATPFTLKGGDIEGGGPVAGLRIAASNEYSYFGIEGEYEKYDTYENASLALRARFQF